MKKTFLICSLFALSFVGFAQHPHHDYDKAKKEESKGNYSKAISLYKSAADGCGVCDAYIALVDAYEYGYVGQSRNWQYSVNYMSRYYNCDKCTYNNDEYAKKIIHHYANGGYGLSRNYSMAAYWSDKIYKYYDAAKYYELAGYYDYAIVEYKKINDYSSIAYIYRYGKGNVSKNLYSAIEYYEKANGSGKYNETIGDIYEELGRYANAVTYYTNAANSGDKDAMLKLAKYYRNGKGVTQNDAQYEYWLDKSATAGNKEALEIKNAMNQIH